MAVTAEIERAGVASSPGRNTADVLVCEGGHGFSRGAVAAVRALAAAGYRPAVTVSTPYSLAGSSRYCTRRVYLTSTFEDRAAFAAGVRRETSSREYAAIVPANDDALVALNWPVQRLLDKSAWTPVAASLGIAVPPTRLFDDADALLAAADDLDYPVVVKPETKRYPARRVDSPRGLLGVPRDGRVIVQPYLDDAMRGMLGLIWRGRILGAVHLEYLRIWPTPCGTASAAVSVAPDLELEQRLPGLLRGYDGIFHLDLAGSYLLDVNPRVHATVGLGVAAGVNLPALYCYLVAGGTPGAMRRGRPGVFFRWLEGDLRSVAHAVRRGSMSLPAGIAALRPRRSEVHGFESVSDPGPLLERLAYAVRRSIGRPRGRSGRTPLSENPRFTG